MRKILLLLVIVSMNMMMGRAQMITISPPSFQIEFIATDNATEATAVAQNNSSITRTLRWVRIVQGAPSEWTSTVCDKNNCYGDTVTTKTFVLDGNTSGLMYLSIYPHDVTGQGHYEIHLWDVNDSVNANAIMIVDATAKPTGISNVSDEAFSIYPNPAKDILHMDLDMSKHVTSVDIHNIVGEKIETVNVQNGLKSVAIPVADLKKGIYFLRVLSNGKEVATMTFSKD